jgi:alkanesulfonate monooxygenase SsuD/methylene tetrahydromethanopterin reductase-like flavin-dependent oxidoreductase (luciferase family)
VHALFGDFSIILSPGKSHPQVYQEGIEQMAAAETLGFHTLWLTEHHFSAYGVHPSNADGYRCCAPHQVCAHRHWRQRLAVSSSIATG